MKHYHPTSREAKKAFKSEYGFAYKDSPLGFHVLIYDLKKTFPRRVATRYFVGTYIQWLNI